MFCNFFVSRMRLKRGVLDLPSESLHYLKRGVLDFPYRIPSLFQMVLGGEANN